MPALSFGNNSQLSTSDDARLSRLEGTVPVVRQGGLLYSNSGLQTPASSSVLANGQISPSQGIAATGNTFTFVVQGAFGFAWNGTSLVVYWDGTNGSTPFVIRRADGSNFSVPKGNIAINGLSGNTKYSFAPFIATAQPDRVSFVVGDAGSPRYALSPNSSPDALALASQTQRLTKNERLTDGLINYTTGAANTSTNGSGSGSYTGSVDSQNNDPNAGL